MIDVTWDEATIERLREMRAEGFTSTQIGRVIGCTRSAVIGKCARLGIATPISPNARGDLGYKAKAPAPPPKPSTSAPYVPPPPPVFSEPSAPIPTAALLPHHCRWSDSVDAPWMHCGRTGFPFCPEHMRRVYQPQKRAS